MQIRSTRVSTIVPLVPEATSSIREAPAAIRGTAEDESAAAVPLADEKLNSAESGPPLDLLPAKPHRLGEGLSARIRAAFFNLFNRSSFGSPDAAASGATRDAGTVLPAVGQARETIPASAQIQP